MDLKRRSVLTFGAFYLFAGVNHFVNPSFYLPLIPESLPYPEAINILSGLIEIVLGVGSLIKRTRKMSAILIILMLVAFIPSHVYFIQIGSCVEAGLCVSPWIAWLRLLVIHPLLIFWAYKVYSFRA